MKKIWIGISIIVVVALATVLFVTQTRKEPKEIKIGAILPLTGESSLMGQWGFNGLMLAKEYINKNGGIHGIPLNILIEDGLGDPKQSVNAYNKLVKIDNVKIITSIISAVDLSLVPFVKKDRIFFLSNATHPDLSNVSPLIYRHANTVQQEVILISSSIPKGVKNITLAYMNDEYSVAFKEQIFRAADQQNLKINAVAFDKNESDFNLVAIKIIEDTPDLVIISGLGRNLGLLITKLKEKGLKEKIFVTLGFVVTGASKSAGSAIKGVDAVYFDMDTESDSYKEINKLYREKYNEDMPIGSLLFFNSLLLIKQAIENVGPDPEKMALFLKGIKEFQGVGEKMTISESNDINPSLKIINY